jgi:hypothetical protein
VAVAERAAAATVMAVAAEAKAVAVTGAAAKVAVVKSTVGGERAKR